MVKCSKVTDGVTPLHIKWVAAFCWTRWFCSYVCFSPTAGKIINLWKAPGWIFVSMRQRAPPTHPDPERAWTTCWCSASCGWRRSGSGPSCDPGRRRWVHPTSETPAGTEAGVMSRTDMRNLIQTTGSLRLRTSRISPKPKMWSSAAAAAALLGL